MSLLGAVVRKIDPKTAINYFRRNLMGSGSLGRKEINKIKGDLKNLSQEDRERLRTADLEDLTPAEVDLVMFGFVGFKDFGMPNKTIAQMKGNEFTTFKNKLNKIVDDVRAGKTESVEEFTFEKGRDGMPDGIKSKMVEKQKELPKGDPTQLTLFNEGGKASMLKPDYIDIDGDGNKTEPMKTAAKQRDNMAIGGIVRALSSKAKQILRRELPKRYDSIVSKEDAKFKVRSTTPDDIIKDYEKGEDIIFYTTDDGTDSAIPESVIEELLEKFDKRNTKAEGGDIDGQMAMLMMTKRT